MSYTLTVRVRTPELCDMMGRFLKKTYRPFRHFLKGFTGDKSITHMTPPAVVAGSRFPTIELEYNAMLGEREYAFALCNWIAIQVGRPRYFQGFMKDTSLPYVLYDHCEAIPLPVRGLWKNVPRQYTVVDRLGVRRATREEMRRGPLYVKFKLEMRSIRCELRRLERKWKRFQEKEAAKAAKKAALKAARAAKRAAKKA